MRSQPQQSPQTIKPFLDSALIYLFAANAGVFPDLAQWNLFPQ